MRIFLTGLVILFALVGVAATGLALFYYGESRTSHFKSYAELEASGLIERGWLPAFLPRSITDISENHDLDTNSVYATFKFNPTDVGTVSANCKLLRAIAEGSKYICPPYDKQTSILILRSDGTGIYESDDNEI